MNVLFVVRFTQSLRVQVNMAGTLMETDPQIKIRLTTLESFDFESKYFGHNGRFIITWGDGEHIIIFDPATGKIVYEICSRTQNESGGISCVDVVFSDKWLVITYKTHVVAYHIDNIPLGLNYIEDLKCEQLTECKTDKHGCRTLSPDGCYLAIQLENVINIWDMNSTKPEKITSFDIINLDNLDSFVVKMTFSRNNEFLTVVVGERSSMWRLFNNNELCNPHELISCTKIILNDGKSRSPICISASNDNTTIAKVCEVSSGLEPNMIHYYNRDLSVNKTLYYNHECHCSKLNFCSITKCEFSPTNQWLLAIATQCGRIDLVDIRGQTSILPNCRVHLNQVKDFMWLNDNQIIANSDNLCKVQFHI